MICCNYIDNQIEMCVLLCVDTDGKGKDSTIWHSTESPPLFGNNARQYWYLYPALTIKIQGLMRYARFPLL